MKNGKEDSTDQTERDITYAKSSIQKTQKKLTADFVKDFIKRRAKGPVVAEVTVIVKMDLHGVYRDVSVSWTYPDHAEWKDYLADLLAQEAGRAGQNVADIAFALEDGNAEEWRDYADYESHKRREQLDFDARREAEADTLETPSKTV